MQQPQQPTQQEAELLQAFGQIAQQLQEDGQNTEADILTRFMARTVPIIGQASSEEMRVQAEINAGTISAADAPRALQEAKLRATGHIFTGISQAIRSEIAPNLPWIKEQEARQASLPLAVRTNTDEVFVESSFKYPPSNPANCNTHPMLQRFHFMLSTASTAQLPAYVQMYAMGSFLSVRDVGRLDSAVTNKALRAGFLLLLRGMPSVALDAHNYRSLSSFRWVARKGIAVRHYDPRLFTVRDGETPLIWACKTNECAIAALLVKLDKGKDINTPSANALDKFIPSGFPLHFAANVRSVPMVEFLLSCKSKGGEHVANTLVRDGLDRNAVHLALVPCIKADSKVSQSAAQGSKGEGAHAAFRIAELLLAADASLATAPESTGLTPLMLACMVGNTPAVNLLLGTYGVPHDTVDRERRNAFFYACKFGHYDAVRALLTFHGDAIRQMLKTGDDAKIYATNVCEIGSADLASFLFIELGLPLPDLGKGKTPLTVACDKGHTELARFFLSEMKVSRDAVDSNKSNALHLACIQGHLDVVRLLVKEFDFDVNAVNRLGYTPLHYACSKGQLECASFLVVDCQAKTNIQAGQGSTPLILATFKNAPAIAAMLIKEGKAEVDIVSNMGTALYVAVESNNAELMEILINDGGSHPDVACQPDGATCLHRAATMGHVNAIHLLLTKGAANPDVALTNGRTALHLACNYLTAKEYRNDTHPVNVMVALLIRAKCNPNVVDRDGKAPIHVAMDNKYLVAATLLAKSGANINIMAFDGQTALTQCIESNDDLSAEALICEFGADVETRDLAGMTPLLVASRVGRLSVVRALVKKSANIDAVNDMGLSALHLAAHFSHQEIVKVLLQAGANASLVDVEGKMAVDFAQLNMIKKLLS